MNRDAELTDSARYLGDVDVIDAYVLGMRLLFAEGRLEDERERSIGERRRRRVPLAQLSVAVNLGDEASTVGVLTVNLDGHEGRVVLEAKATGRRELLWRRDEARPVSTRRLCRSVIE